MNNKDNLGLTTVMTQRKYSKVYTYIKKSYFSFPISPNRPSCLNDEPVKFRVSCDLSRVNNRQRAGPRFKIIFTITSKRNAVPHCVLCLKLHPWSHKVLIIH